MLDIATDWIWKEHYLLIITLIFELISHAGGKTSMPFKLARELEGKLTFFANRCMLQIVCCVAETNTSDTIQFTSTKFATLQYRRWVFLSRFVACVNTIHISNCMDIITQVQSTMAKTNSPRKIGFLAFAMCVCLIRHDSLCNCWNTVKIFNLLRLMIISTNTYDKFQRKWKQMLLWTSVEWRS